MLRKGTIYLEGGKLVIKPHTLSIHYVTGFEHIKIPNSLVGNAPKLLNYLLNTTKITPQQFALQSGINPYLLQTLLRGTRKATHLITKQLESATNIAAKIWLSK